MFFLIDVNNAFLSWEAVYRLYNNEKLDIRNIASIISSNTEKDKGIVLAKSNKAKEFGIKTADTVIEAQRKCKNLFIAQSNYSLYLKSSNAFNSILKEYSDLTEQFSIDETFLKTDNILVAEKIKKRIKNELGFTINIGIGDNKLLAKMASDLKKPDSINTIFKNEIQDKMWPLSVNKLFGVGKMISSKLNRIGIYTIGDLALTDINLLVNHFNTYGITLSDYANGIDNSKIIAEKIKQKSISNSTTFSQSTSNKNTIYNYLLGISEMVSKRLREQNSYFKVINIKYKTDEFKSYSHQKKISFPVNTTTKIFNLSKELFENIYAKKHKVRAIAVSVTSLTDKKINHIPMKGISKNEKLKNLDKTIDKLRNKYGNNIIKRATFINSKTDHMIGGTKKEKLTLKLKSHLNIKK